MFDAIAEVLNRGESVLLYPSGRLSRTGTEAVGSTRAAAELLQRCPQAKIVLVRTTGLWGSMFGCARTGRVPDLTKTLLSALGWLLANLVFFLPRRRVEIEIEVLDRSCLPGIGREELNPFLERWYNQQANSAANASVEPVFVPYHFFFGLRRGPFSMEARGDRQGQTGRFGESVCNKEMATG
jgi:long-chain-fatty-acid--[acyl-carrier-protein] ligase